MTQYAQQLKAMNVIEISRDDWLKERETVIGGTDNAKMFTDAEGALYVYCRKLGLIQEEEPTEEMIEARELGLVKERPLAEYWAKKHGFDLVAAPEGSSFFCRHPLFPFIAGSPDFFLARNGVIIYIMEMKTRHEFDTSNWLNERQLPMAPIAQGHTYIACLGLPLILVGETGAQKLRDFLIEPDAGIENHIIESDKGLYECIQTKTPPPLMYGKVTTEYLKAKYSTHNAELVRLDGELDLLLTEGFEVHAQKKALEEREQFITAVMRDVMKESGGVQGTAGTYKLVCGRKDKDEVNMSAVVDRLVHDYKISADDLEKIKLECQRTVKGFFRGLWKENK